MPEITIFFLHLSAQCDSESSPVRGGIVAEEDLWLLRGQKQPRSSETTSASAASSRPSFRSQSEENFLVASSGQNNHQHIYMEVPKRTSTTAEEYDESDLSSAATASAGSNGRGYQQQQQNPAMMSQC